MKNGLERMIAIGGSSHVKVGDVNENDVDKIGADLFTKEQIAGAAL